jgi:hypothetical protein
MKKLLILFMVFITFSACSKLEDLNTNTKDFTVVPGEAIFNGATRSLVNQMFTPNVNSNNTMLWIQHWAETTYPDESRYDMVTRPVPANHQNAIYRTVLANYKEAAKLISAKDIVLPNEELIRKNQLAIIEIMSIYAWSNLVETYGNIPYTEALNFADPTPAYDDGLTVYKDLITRLNAALANMTPTSAGMPSGYDNIYGGTAAGTVNWMKFANTLKLRMGLLLADLDAAYAKPVIESAAPNVFTAGNKAALTYLSASPNQNPVYTELVVSGRNDFVITSVLINAMQPTVPASSILTLTVTDPRLKYYASTVEGTTTYLGGSQGEPNSYPTYSHVNPALLTSTREVVIMDYAEAEFLLAEAVERGFAVGGTAEGHYNNAITASILYWGGTAAEAAAYLAQPTVAYTTASGTWKQKIGTQAWLAFFERGMTAWTSYRKLDFPILVAPVNHVEGIDKVPTRYTFAVSEQTLNNENYTKAASDIGGDSPLKKLFWDKN